MEYLLKIIISLSMLFGGVIGLAWLIDSIPMSPLQREAPYGERHRWPMFTLSVLTAGLLFGAIAPWSYTFYICLRWIVAIVALYSYIQLSELPEYSRLRRLGKWLDPPEPPEYSHIPGVGPWLALLMIVVAVLFNPVIPVHLSREIWRPIDIGSGLLFLFNALLLYLNRYPKQIAERPDQDQDASGVVETNLGASSEASLTNEHKKPESCLYTVKKGLIYGLCYSLGLLIAAVVIFVICGGPIFVFVWVLVWILSDVG